MARVLKNKVLVNTRLATNYGGWMYCDCCSENIGYLCYSTYDRIELSYQCCCGSSGKVIIDFEDSRLGKTCDEEFIIVKNRFCCSKDQSPLVTILDKKVEHYEMNITCKTCGNIYQKLK